MSWTVLLCAIALGFVLAKLPATEQQGKTSKFWGLLALAGVLFCIIAVFYYTD